jgi:hypothetical protein
MCCSTPGREDAICYADQFAGPISVVTGYSPSPFCRDINTTGECPRFEQRTYPKDPEKANNAAPRLRAFVRGLRLFAVGSLVGWILGQIAGLLYK